MSNSNTPFSHVGNTGDVLLGLISKIDTTGVTLSPNGAQLECNGQTACIRPVGRSEDFGISAIGEPWLTTLATCERTNEINGVVPTRYTGACSSDNIAGEFLVECIGSRNDFVHIMYYTGFGEDNTANFTAYGQAKAYFSDIFVDAIDLYKQSQWAETSRQDVFVFCGN